MQKLLDTVAFFEKGDGCSASAEAVCQAAISAVRKVLRDGGSTGDKALDSAFLLRRVQIFAFAEVLRWLEDGFARNKGSPVAVVYGERSHIAVGAIDGPAFSVDGQAQVMLVPTCTYEMLDRVTGDVRVCDGAIPLGSSATCFSPQRFSKTVWIGHKGVADLVREVTSRPLRHEEAGLVDVVRIGTSALDKRVPNQGFNDQSYMQSHARWQQEEGRVAARELELLLRYARS